ncbi:MAG: hypothetical protein COZ34_00520 [Candidatus Pacebacteria bacterium CG_4_10_14_3_um_filter_34_15]|nr:hypothetical protein [Candidatus Pacearchaeota archaeon]NCQ65586.1 hypothetical protein [Candidatus Paceibacterota bacterium]OIO43814.1 MAG: hypothetical protein AUJ41_04180 [Candidatus Pacebacteria bacterium CG1_02_43_31]PIQ80731.1 MAG: hypothetical protein COV78_04020 [Candidatus Pacebacteria bacterium CG11_big_fil_rev_8_21_14_0_20_34_55]PIX81954.1 MAG: hypothetical protein COZ34_00520 [Candidatus Pacebacteria bacterium CG_4_10_14_3_um_filter_34_15]PJC43417.1 MAG: hypothetical protein CO0
MNKKSEITSILNHFYQNPVAKVSLELFLTIGLVLFLAVFAIKPTILTMSNLIKEIENKEKLEKQLTQKIAALQTAQTEYLSVESLLPALDEAIPSTPEIIKSAKIIEKAAADNKIIIKNMSVLELPQNDSVDVPFSQKAKQKLNFNVSISGDYISIRNFAESLRNSRKSFVIDSVTFQLEEDRGSRKLNASFSISVPYFGIETKVLSKAGSK